MRLRRPLGPIRRQVRTHIHAIKPRHQPPHLVHRRPPHLRRPEKVIKDPLGLHRDGEEGRVPRLPSFVRGRHGGREPGHAVKAKGPFGIVGLGRDIPGPRSEVAGSETAEEGPELAAVGVHRGFSVIVGGCWGRVDDNEAGVWAQGAGEREVGAHGGGEEAEVARLGGVVRGQEDVAVLVVFVAAGGVDAGEPLGSWVSGHEDRFKGFVCLTLPGLFE